MDERARPNRRAVVGGLGATLAALPLAAGAAAQPDGADARARALLDAIAEERLVIDPGSASGLGLDTGRRATLRARLKDCSRAGRAREQAFVQRRLAQLKALDTARLSPATRIDVDIVAAAFETGAEGFAFAHGDVAVGEWRNGPYVVAQNMGSYLDVPKLLDTSHKLETATDVDAYLARLDAWAINLDHETARMTEARQARVVAPDFTLDKTLAGLRLTASGDPANWSVVAALVAAKRARHATRAAAIATARIVPALRRQIAEIEAHRAVATSEAGVWKQPDGDAYYAWALRAATTTRLTPDDVHARGLDDLATLQGEMDPILRKLGLGQGTVGARMTALGRDPRFQFPAGAAGRAEIMAEIERRLVDMRNRLPRAFTSAGRTDVRVVRISPAEEAGAPGAYGGPGSIDGSIPGRFFINLVEPWRHNRFDLPTLCYHEALPGHVWQGNYNQKLSLVRAPMYFSAFGEGWGLYAEQLGNELGVYDDDPVGRLGYLQSMAFRACRLVVDTGLHAKRWTRAQAIEWFATTNGSDVASVTGEVDRYCVWPGQACGYKIGHSEINRLRRMAQAELGPRYDFRAFNELVVGGGAMPLTMLEARVRAYIATRRS